MVTRIRMQSTRHIFFASRVQLINFVLLCDILSRHKFLFFPNMCHRRLNKSIEHFYGMVSTLVGRLFVLNGAQCALLRVLVAWASGTSICNTLQKSMFGQWRRKLTIFRLNGYMLFTVNRRIGWVYVPTNQQLVLETNWCYKGGIEDALYC